ncbi:hypothetical protein ACIQOV_28410 [Kitasatospora sp. NPDC091257]
MFNTQLGCGATIPHAGRGELDLEPLAGARPAAGPGLEPPERR